MKTKIGNEFNDFEVIGLNVFDMWLSAKENIMFKFPSEIMQNTRETGGAYPDTSKVIVD